MGLKTNDIRNMTVPEIKHKLILVREELFKLRFERKSGRVEKPHRMLGAKKEIARMLTILREKKNEKK